MTQVIIRPSRIQGTVQAPASKSSMQRACAASLLAGGETLIRNPGKSNDDEAAKSVIRNLGATTEFLPDGNLVVRSRGVDPRADHVHCGESGLGIRMFTPIIALSPRPITIEGSGSLLTRPMDFFDEILPRLGVSVNSNKGRLPVIIRGPLRPADIEIDGSLSSQFLTGLLMAFAASNTPDVTIRVNNLKSRPYIDLTLKVMREFGLKVPENRDYEEFYFSANNQPKKTDYREYTVEGDWSGGAFLLVAAAIAGNAVIKGLDGQSSQADKAIGDALLKAGANWKPAAGLIHIGPPESGPAGLRSFDFDATDCPDLFPPLVALAAYCNGTSSITGAKRLTHKESNRAITLQEEFGKMGIQIGLDGDRMLIHGGGSVKGALTHSHHDHRIAMACAVAALAAEGETTIQEAQAIDKSYPDFYEDLKKLGAAIEITRSFINSQ